MAEKLTLPALPPRGSAPIEYLKFFNVAVRRDEDLLVRVDKYGDSLPLFTLTFESGRQLRTSSRALAGTGLLDVLADFDGTFAPAYSRPQCTILRAALVRGAEAHEADDERSDLVLDLDAFFEWTLDGLNPVLLRPDAADRENPSHALYRAAADFKTLNQGRSGHPYEKPPALLFWITTDGEIGLWVPRGALAKFLHERRARVVGRELRNLLESLGWKRREINARAGEAGRRAHIKVWTVPVPWEECTTDLASVLADTRLHADPLWNNTREDEQSSRDRGRDHRVSVFHPDREQRRR